MTYANDLRELWLSVGEVPLPIAAVRDEYVRFGGIHRRFSRLNDVYHQLFTIETALFEFLESKKPLFGQKPEREVLMIARAAVENAKVLSEIARAELQLLGD
jgi:hypothetical protein